MRLKNLNIKTKFVVIFIIIMLVTITTLAYVRAREINAQINTFTRERLRNNAHVAIGVFDALTNYTDIVLEAFENEPYTHHYLARTTDNILADTDILAMLLLELTRHEYESFINIADENNIIFLSNRSEYIGQHIYDLGVHEALGYMPLNRVFPHTSLITGEDKIAYITEAPHLGWTVISFFNTNAIDSLALSIFISLLPTLSIFLVATILMIYLVIRTLSPLRTLALAAKEVAGGNVFVHFDSERNDEIGQVSRSFFEVVNALNLLEDNFVRAERAMSHGDMEYHIEDSRLGGVFNELFEHTNSIIKHMQQAKTEAEAASRTKSDFLSKMSHEIRTPMNAVMGMSELALRENISPIARRYVESIKQSGAGLLTIINNILDFSKIESGKMEITEAEYQPAALVQDIVNIINVRMLGTDLRLEINISDKIPSSLYGDYGRLHQIILNLMNNAVKYTPTGFVALDIDCEPIEDETDAVTERVNLCIKVRDSGRGIKQENLQMLFNEFTQLDTDANRGIEGTGLGLAIVKNLTHMMGGKTDVESFYGTGSIFTVIVPQGVVDSSQAAEPIKQVQSFETHAFEAPTAKVLVVDDMETNLRVAEGFLRPFKVVVELCYSGAEAVEAVQRTDFDLIFMDHMMPEMNGIECTEAIRKLATADDDKYTTLPIVALTANAVIGMKEMFLRSGLNDFISKPIEITQFNNIMAKWIPKEKQQHTQDVHMPAYSHDSAPPIDLIIDGVDVARGIKLAGNDISFYHELLKVFHKDAKERVQEIPTCLKNKNFPLYTVYVHALKSACSNIGANALSDEAARLEAAVYTEDVAYIMENNDGFVQRITNLLDDITAILVADTTMDTSEDLATLATHAAQLKQAIDSFNMPEIDRLCEILQKYKTATDMGETVNAILQAVLTGNYKRALEHIAAIASK